MISAWAAVKRFFNPPRGEFHELDDQFGFPSLDLRELKAHLDLDEKARRNGAAGIPPQDQQISDGTEHEIRNEVTSRIADAKTRVAAELDHIETAILRRQLAPKIQRCKTIGREFLDKVTLQMRTLESNLDRLKSERDEFQGEVDAYRSKYAVPRGPRLIEQEDRYVAQALLAIFALIQLMANAALLSEGSLYGLAFGLFLSVILAFFDILIHFNLGWLGAWVQAPDSRSKWLGRFGLAFSVLTVSAWNLGLVHLRLVNRVSAGRAAAGWDLWLPSLVDNTFGFSDFLSWALLVVGILCSVLAIRAGWLWDEPIPVFRDLGRRIARAESDIGRLDEQRSGLQLELREQFLSELDGIDKDAEHHVSLVAGHVKRLERRVADFVTYKTKAAEVFGALVASYRDENLRARTSPVPAYFNEEAQLTLSEHEVENKADRFKKFEADAVTHYEELKALLPQARSVLLGIEPHVGGGEP